MRAVEWGKGRPRRADERTATIYVVVVGRWPTGDYAGVSVTADRVWFQHVSSSLSYLRRDTTDGFSDRRRELEEAYPDGYEVVLVDPAADLPEEIAHHFTESPPPSAVDELRSRLSGWHFAKESLTPGEREILAVAEAVLAELDRRDDNGYAR